MISRRLRLELAPSPLLAIVIVALHAAAGLSILTVMPPLPGVPLAVLLLVLGIALAWSRALLRSRSSVRAMELDGPQLEVLLASGERFRTEIPERRYVSRFAVSILLRRPVRRTILVTQDMLGGDLFRRLRIWAVWGKLPGVAAKQLPL